MYFFLLTSIVLYYTVVFFWNDGLVVKIKHINTNLLFPNKVNQAKPIYMPNWRNC